MLALKSRTAIINWLIAEQGYRSYLEIGVGDGGNFAAVQCAEKESVDPKGDGYAGAEATHELTSDEFFARNQRGYDLIFIDGLHHAEVVYRDMVNALAALNPGGMIVCHDMNPQTEEMQAVPRQVREWTGDCWRAWLKLRAEREDLCMVVADIDYGVGVIFPSGVCRADRFDGDVDGIDFKAFRKNRDRWLPLAPPLKLPDSLGLSDPPGRYTEDYDSWPLTVVTLWRPAWNEVHDDLLDWIASEPFPEGTRLIWMFEEGSASEPPLVGAAARLREGRGLVVEEHSYPPQPINSSVEKHHWVAQLYNEAILRAHSPLTLFLEDDTLPPPGGSRELIEQLDELPDETACVAATYRTRGKPSAACASRCGYWRPIDWAEIADMGGTTEVGWVGGGFTLYRTRDLRDSLPLYCTAYGGRLEGWDILLCREMRGRGKTIYLSPEVRAEHRCSEVLQHCEEHGIAIA